MGWSSCFVEFGLKGGAASHYGAKDVRTQASAAAAPKGGDGQALERSRGGF